MIEYIKDMWYNQLDKLEFVGRTDSRFRLFIIPYIIKVLLTAGLISTFYPAVYES